MSLLAAICLPESNFSVCLGNFSGFLDRRPDAVLYVRDLDIMTNRSDLRKRSTQRLIDGLFQIPLHNLQSLAMDASLLSSEILGLPNLHILKFLIPAGVDTAVSDGDEDLFPGVIPRILAMPSLRTVDVKEGAQKGFKPKRVTGCSFTKSPACEYLFTPDRGVQFQIENLSWTKACENYGGLVSVLRPSRNFKNLVVIPPTREGCTEHDFDFLEVVDALSGTLEKLALGQDIGNIATGQVNFAFHVGGRWRPPPGIVLRRFNRLSSLGLTLHLDYNLLQPLEEFIPANVEFLQIGFELRWRGASQQYVSEAARKIMSELRALELATRMGLRQGLKKTVCWISAGNTFDDAGPWGALVYYLSTMWKAFQQQGIELWWRSGIGLSQTLLVADTEGGCGNIVSLEQHYTKQQRINIVTGSERKRKRAQEE